jgi:hypothetical protein
MPTSLSTVACPAFDKANLRIFGGNCCEPNLSAKTETSWREGGIRTQGADNRTTTFEF